MDILYLTGAYKAFQAFLSVPLKVLEFLKEIETARLGIGSVIATTMS